MQLRTYFWHDRSGSRLRWAHNTYIRRNSDYFRIGNVGDLFAKKLIDHLYGCEAKNTNISGKRALFVGSIAHVVKSGDLLCGIGTQRRNISVKPCQNVTVWALRGPITYDIFKQGGFDVSHVRFLLDPGMMIRFTTPKTLFDSEKKHVSFIPHYRERFMYWRGLPQGMRMIDVDARPDQIAQKILESKLVYASSLHGIIFSHALGVPCIFVKPQTNESMLKYEDYYMSVDLPMQRPLMDIHDANFLRDSDTPPHIKISRDQFEFPTIDDLSLMGYLD